jgi:hypothetical protein
MRGPDRRIALLVALGGLTAALALATPALPLLLRAAGAVALAFALPGAACLWAFMPTATLRRSERVAIALGGSMAVVVATAFALHALPSGLTATSWAAALGSITVAGGLVGWLRLTLRPSAAPTAATASPPVTAGPWVAGPPPDAMRDRLPAPTSVAMLVAAGVLVTLALVVARAGVDLGPRTAFTELWMLPIDGGSSIRLGVGNHEGSAQVYQVVVAVDGRRLGGAQRFALPDGAAASTVVGLPSAGPTPRLVEVRLWTDGQSTDDPPHRLVRATVEGAGEEGAAEAVAVP